MRDTSNRNMGNYCAAENKGDDQILPMLNAQQVHILSIIIISEWLKPISRKQVIRQQI